MKCFVHFNSHYSTFKSTIGIPWLLLFFFQCWDTTQALLNAGQVFCHRAAFPASVLSYTVPSYLLHSVNYPELPRTFEWLCILATCLRSTQYLCGTEENIQCYFSLNFILALFFSFQLFLSYRFTSSPLNKKQSTFDFFLLQIKCEKILCILCLIINHFILVFMPSQAFSVLI